MLLLTTASLASGLAVQAYGTVLTPPDGRWFVGGIGAPTVDHDPSVGQWVMYFEGHSGTAMGSCDDVWSIGRATSPDGIDWVADPEPVIIPDYTGVTRHCRAVQPAVAWDGASWHLVYANAYEDDDYSQPLSGSFTHATSTDGVTWTTVDEALAQEPTVTSRAGLPSLAIADDGLFVAYNTPGAAALLHEPAGSVDDWADPVAISSTSSTGKDRMPLSPSLACDPSGTHALLAWSLTEGDDRTLVRASSDDGVDWQADADDWLDVSAFGPGQLRHIDVLRLAETDEDVVLYYSNGTGSIGAAATLPTWSGTASRACLPASAGPPASPPPERRLEGEADAGLPQCGCSTGGAGAWAWLGGLLLLRRRPSRC